LGESESKQYNNLDLGVICTPKIKERWKSKNWYCGI